MATHNPPGRHIILDDDFFASSKTSKKRTMDDKASAQLEQQRRIAARQNAVRRVPDTTARNNELLEKEKQLLERERALNKREVHLTFKDSSGDASVMKRPPHEAMEKILYLFMEEVRKKKMAYATDNSAVVKPVNAWDPWHFRDVDGSMKPVAPYMKPALDWLRRVGSVNPVTSSSFASAFAPHLPPALVDADWWPADWKKWSATPPIANLQKDLYSGKIFPAYNGLQFFGGIVLPREHGTRELEFPATNRLLSDALAADMDTPYVLDVFRAIPHSRSPRVISGHEETDGLHRMAWCMQLDFEDGQQPAVVGEHTRRNHPYMLWFPFVPGAVLLLIPFYQHFVLLDASGTNNDENKEYADFLTGRCTLRNFLIYHYVAHAKPGFFYDVIQDYPDGKNIDHVNKFAKAMNTKNFPTHFKKYLLDSVKDIYQGEHGGGGIPDVEAALEELEKEGAQIRRESMYLQNFYAWCLGTDISDEHNEADYIKKYMGNLPTQRKYVTKSNKLYCYIDGMTNLKDPVIDPSSSWYELHEAPWTLLSDVLFALTFYDPDTKHFDKCHMWLQLHGKTGRHDYYYDMKRGGARSNEFFQVSRHNNRTAVVTQSIDPPAATRTEAYWSSMTLELSNDVMNHLKYGYKYDTKPYMIRSVIFSQFAALWHDMARVHKYDYDTTDGSMLFVHPARLSSFLAIVDSRFHGGLRVGWHGTKSIPSIATDVTGFNMKYSHTPRNGSMYGSGIYIGFDDHIAHTYVESPCPVGNVLMVFSGWHANPARSCTVNNNVAAGHTLKLNEPFCTMFKHLSRSGSEPGNHYDGAVFFQDCEVHVWGEAVREGNDPMAMQAQADLAVLLRSDIDPDSKAGPNNNDNGETGPSSATTIDLTTPPSED